MIKATRCDRGAKPDDVIHGNSIVIRDAFDNPIAIFTEVAPGQIQEFSIALDEHKFRAAAEAMGLNFEITVRDLKL